jgi:TonB family protein
LAKNLHFTHLSNQRAFGVSVGYSQFKNYGCIRRNFLGVEQYFPGTEAVMRLAILLFCCAAALGQTNAPHPSDQKPKTQDYGLGVGAPGKQFGGVDILSDTQGVDFGPYLKKALADVRDNWYRLIPASSAMKQGKLAIEFAITKDGKIGDMRLVASAGDNTLDRAAWGSITACNPFKPLPDKFTGQYLALRMRFYYNPDKSDMKLGSN